MGKGRKENLKPISERTSEELRAMATKGGKKSGEVRKQKKLLKDTIEMLMESKPTPKMVKMYADMFGFNPKDLQDVITGGLIRKAMQGDSKAFEVLRDTMGQKPKEVIESTNANIAVTDKKVVDEVFKKLKEL
jgi:DNA invertase Pin-like site-specific DNA recombinase